MNEIFTLLTAAYEVAWMDVGDVNLNDPDVKSIRAQLTSDLRVLTVSELKREVGNAEQIALMCPYELPAGLSDKLLKAVRWLLQPLSISAYDWEM